MATYFKSDTFAGVWVRVPLPAPTFSTPEETANRGGLFVWLLTTPCNAGINPRAMASSSHCPTYLPGHSKCNGSMFGVHPDYEIWLSAGAWSTSSWCHVSGLFLAMPRINEQVPMKACWFGFLGLGELSPVDDNLHGHGYIPIRHWAITAGSVL